MNCGTSLEGHRRKFALCVGLAEEGEVDIHLPFRHFFPLTLCLGKKC